MELTFSFKTEAVSVGKNVYNKNNPSLPYQNLVRLKSRVKIKIKQKQTLMKLLKCNDTWDNSDAIERITAWWLCDQWTRFQQIHIQYTNYILVYIYGNEINLIIDGKNILSLFDWCNVLLNIFSLEACKLLTPMCKIIYPPSLNLYTNWPPPFPLAEKKNLIPPAFWPPHPPR